MTISEQLRRIGAYRIEGDIEEQDMDPEAQAKLIAWRDSPDHMMQGERILAWRHNGTSGRILIYTLYAGQLMTRGDV